MPARSKRIARSEKLDLRLTPQAKRTLQAAAEVRQKTMTEFVLDSALMTATDVLAEQRTIQLSAEQWKRFRQALDAPPQGNARLRRLLIEPSVFD